MRKSKTVPPAPDLNDPRRRAIEDAAFELLILHGYKATSMLAVARQAQASNETLYRWYGNKQALFLCMVERNATETRETIIGVINGDEPLAAVLARLGPVLLSLVLEERAVALHRAAVGDVHDTGKLGGGIVAGGRGSVEVLLTKVMARTPQSGITPAQAASAYLDLLIGDSQIRRVIGVDAAPTPDWIQKRARRATRIALYLLAQSKR